MNVALADLVLTFRSLAFSAVASHLHYRLGASPWNALLITLLNPLAIGIVPLINALPLTKTKGSVARGMAWMLASVSLGVACLLGAKLFCKSETLVPNTCAVSDGDFKVKYLLSAGFHLGVFLTPWHESPVLLLAMCLVADLTALPRLAPFRSTLTLAPFLLPFLGVSLNLFVTRYVLTPQPSPQATAPPLGEYGEDEGWGTALPKARGRKGRLEHWPSQGSRNATSPGVGYGPPSSTPLGIGSTHPIDLVDPNDSSHPLKGMRSDGSKEEEEEPLDSGGRGGGKGTGIQGGSKEGAVLESGLGSAYLESVPLFQMKIHGLHVRDLDEATKARIQAYVAKRLAKVDPSFLLLLSFADNCIHLKVTAWRPRPSPSLPPTPLALTLDASELLDLLPESLRERVTAVAQQPPHLTREMALCPPALLIASNRTVLVHLAHTEAAFGDPSYHDTSYNETVPSCGRTDGTQKSHRQPPPKDPGSVKVFCSLQPHALPSTPLFQRHSGPAASVLLPPTFADTRSCLLRAVYPSVSLSDFAKEETFLVLTQPVSEELASLSSTSRTGILRDLATLIELRGATSPAAQLPPDALATARKMEQWASRRHLPAIADVAGSFRRHGLPSLRLASRLEGVKDYVGACLRPDALTVYLERKTRVQHIFLSVNYFVWSVILTRRIELGMTWPDALFGSPSLLPVYLHLLCHALRFSGPLLPSLTPHLPLLYVGAECMIVLDFMGRKLGEWPQSFLKAADLKGQATYLFVILLGTALHRAFAVVPDALESRFACLCRLLAYLLSLRPRLLSLKALLFLAVGALSQLLAAIVNRRRLDRFRLQMAREEARRRERERQRVRKKTE